MKYETFKVRLNMRFRSTQFIVHSKLALSTSSSSFWFQFQFQFSQFQVQFQLHMQLYMQQLHVTQLFKAITHHLTISDLRYIAIALQLQLAQPSSLLLRFGCRRASAHLYAIMDTFDVYPYLHFYFLYFFYDQQAVHSKFSK